MKKPNRVLSLRASAAAICALLSCLLFVDQARAQSLIVNSNMTINNGTTNYYTGVYVGNDTSENTLTVSEPGTILTNPGGLYIAYTSGTSSNTLVLSNQATMYSMDSYLGGIITPGSNNSILVTGTNTIWNNNLTNFMGGGGFIQIGQIGTNSSLTISNGGYVRNDASSSAFIILGDTTSSLSNSLIVTGNGSTLTNSGYLTIGNNGSDNIMTISHGGAVYDVRVRVGYNSSSLSNSVLVTGSNSLLSNGSDSFIGYSGSANSLTISNAGQVVVNGGGSLNIGYNSSSSNNAVLVTGSNSTLNVDGDIAVGVDGVRNSLTISNGGSAQAANVYIGENSNSHSNSALVTGSNSSLVAAAQIYIGGDRGGQTNTLTVANGGSVAATLITLGNSGDSSGNALNVGSFGGSDAAGSLGTSTITFLGDNNALNFNQTNTEIISNQITGTGFNNVNQLGSGTTVLIESNGYVGQTIVSNGTLVLSNSSAIGRSDLIISGGVTEFTTNTTFHSLTWQSTNAVMNMQSTNANFNVSAFTISDVGTNYFAVSDVDNATILLGTYTNGTNIFTTNVGILGATNATMTITNIGGVNYLSYRIVSGSDLVVVGSESITSNAIYGNVSYRDNGTLTIASTATLTVTNDYTSTNSGTLICDFTTTNAPVLITVSNTMTLGGTFVGNFVQGPNFGSIYKFATAQTLSSNFSAIQIDVNNVLNPLFRGRMLTNGDPELDLLVAPTSYTEVAANQNQVNVARALDSFITAPSSTDQYTVSLALDQLTAAEYPNAFQQISPALYSSLSTIAFNTANAQNNELVQRLGNIRVAGVGFDSAGLGDPTMVDDNKNPKPNGKDVLIPSADNHWGIFTDANGIFANVNINNQLPGYSSESGGITLGADYKWNETFSTGIYTGYQGTQSKQSGGNFICDNSCRFGLFGTYQRGGLFANAIIGGDSHSYQIDRTIQFSGINRTATSAPTAGELDSMLATGYDIKRGNFTFGPTTSLQYTYLGVQPFTEAGAQSLNLNVSNENANSMIYSLGSHCFYTWQLNKEVLIVPQINLAWQHEFLQNPYAINSTLQGGGGNFTYMTTTPNRDSLYTGIGFTVNLAKKYDASFFYNASAGNSDLVSQNFFASVGTKF